MITELCGVDGTDIQVESFPARNLKLSYIDEIADAPMYTMVYDGGGKEIDEAIWAIVDSFKNE